MDSTGVSCDNEARMGTLAIEYFEEIFSSHLCTDMDDTIQVVNQVVNLEMNQQMMSPFTKLEVKQVAFQMHPSKAPRPNGMSSFFFKKFWHITGGDVVHAMLSILNSGHMLQKINHSHIVLIPKRKNPKVVAAY